MAEVSFHIREIVHGDRVTGLSLGDSAFQPLKTFLQRHAKAYSQQLLARSYGAFHQQRLVGYVTLVCGQVAVEAGEPAPDLGDVKYRYSEFPALKIARLAVDRRYRQRGYRLGSQLVEASVGLARRRIAPVVGCRYIVLDSKKQSIEFYEKNGFKMINTDVNRQRKEPIMYRDLLHISQEEADRRQIGP